MNNQCINNQNSRGAYRAPWLTIVTAAVCVILYVLPPVVFRVLSFDHTAVIQGQWWRILTGHLVHCTFEHLFWDIAALLVLGSVIELTDRKAFLPSLIWSSLVLGLWLMLPGTGIVNYCGLSGSLNGLLSVAAMMMWNKTKERTYVLVLAAAAAKIAFESLTHLTVFTSLSSQAVPAAHAVGLLAGLIFVFRKVLLKRIAGVCSYPEKLQE